MILKIRTLKAFFKIQQAKKQLSKVNSLVFNQQLTAILNKLLKKEVNQQEGHSLLCQINRQHIPMILVQPMQLMFIKDYMSKQF